MAGHSPFAPSTTIARRQLWGQQDSTLMNDPAVHLEASSSASCNASAVIQALGPVSDDVARSITSPNQIGHLLPNHAYTEIVQVPDMSVGAQQHNALSPSAGAAESITQAKCENKGDPRGDSEPPAPATTEPPAESQMWDLEDDDVPSSASGSVNREDLDVCDCDHGYCPRCFDYMWNAPSHEDVPLRRRNEAFELRLGMFTQADERQRSYLRNAAEVHDDPGDCRSCEGCAPLMEGSALKLFLKENLKTKEEVAREQEEWGEELLAMLTRSTGGF